MHKQTWEPEGKKRIFIFLGMITLLVYGTVFAGIWFLATRASDAVKQVVAIGLISAVIMILFAMMAGLGFLVFGLLKRSNIPILQKINRAIVDFFYPAVMVVGRFFGISSDVIDDSYLKIHNQMTVAGGKSFAPSELLILAPHCLQKSDCPHKITADVKNCKRCGRCSVDGLLTVAEQNQVELVVATGGTLARRMVKEKQPKAVIAIACERDLTSGIRDINKRVSVVGVLNERPNGPCYNTTVQICKVQQAIDFFLHND